MDRFFARPRLTLPIAGALLIASAGCRPAAPPPPDLAAMEAEVRAASTSLVNAEEAGDFDTAVGFYAPDAIVQPANAPQIQGADAIRALYDQVFEEMQVQEMEGTTTAITVATSGDMAWEYGVNRLVFDSPNGPVTDMGKYLGVWIKRDGAWKVVALAFSSDAPPPSER